MTHTTIQELLLTPFNVHEILGFEILSSQKHFCQWEISEILFHVRGVDPCRGIPSPRFGAGIGNTMTGTQKVGARQHNTTFAGIWACCVRRPHTAARNCTRLPSASLYPSVTIIGFTPLSRKRRGWRPTIEAMCLWQTFVSSQCVRTNMIVANTPRVSPSLEPTTWTFPRSRSTIDDDRGPQVFKIVDFFSLPPFVSRSTTHFGQLISQIVQKRPKSGLRSEHSEVSISRHVVWTDSILIEANQRKKYKLASLLSDICRFAVSASQTLEFLEIKTVHARRFWNLEIALKPLSNFQFLHVCRNFSCITI